jgi:Uma2 family endonuclease
LIGALVVQYAPAKKARFAMTTRSSAALEELYSIPENGKAEIVDGELVAMAPTGFLPGRAGGEIYSSLRAYERRMKNGYAIPDNVGFAVNLPGRSSFSPDAAYYTGRVTGMKFLEGAPVFAAEIRSQNDYGEHADEAIATKRADYFAAGALVVWDVDLLGADVVKVYRMSDPEHPTIYRRGDLAEAEPAVPGWLMPVDDLFN